MKEIFRNLVASFKEIFPKGGGHRARGLMLILIASVIPLSQLFVIKIFSAMILHSTKTLDNTEIVINFLIFFALFGSTHLATYWQKVYRVRVFERAFASSGRKTTKFKESWEWALAFEMSNLLHMATTALVLITFFAAINIWIGLLNVVVVAISFEIVGVIYRRQMKTQQGFAEARDKKQQIDTAVRVGARIRSGEFGTLMISVGYIALLAVLLILKFKDLIVAADAITLFLGMRMQNSNLSNVSGALMRYARARAQAD